MSCNPKIVVFDLDETLGYFVEFGMFWDALQNFIKQNTEKLFENILEMHKKKE
jgi:hypothetical protein